MKKFPKTLNKKYHSMIADYRYDDYDKLHDVVLKDEYDNGNDGQQILESTVRDLNRALSECFKKGEK